MELDLVDRGRLVGARGQTLQMLNLEVRHPDRACAPIAGGTPRASSRSRRSRRRTASAAANGSGTGRRSRSRAPRASVERSASVVGTVKAVVELAGDEYLGAIEAGGASGVADSALVAVHLGRIDVPVADLECGADRLSGVLWRDLEDAEPQLGDRVAVVQARGSGWCWNGAHACRSLSVETLCR